jgi:hypothetical protein
VLAVTFPEIASSVVALAAFCTAIGVLSRLRPSKWLWRHIVSNPARDWANGLLDEKFDDKLAPIYAELSYNGGSTTKDAVARLEVHAAAQSEQLARIDDRTERLGRANELLDVKLHEHMEIVASKIDAVTVEVTTINGLTMATLADRAEVRRLDNLNVRTDAEQTYVDNVHEQENNQ